MIQLIFDISILMYSEVDQKNHVSIGLHSGRQCLFTFQLSFDNDASTPGHDTRLSGFRAIFYVFWTGIASDIQAVIRLLRNHPALRVIHFDFVSNDHLVETMARLSWSELSAPPFQDCEFVLTPAERELPASQPLVHGIDSLIFDPTGGACLLCS